MIELLVKLGIALAAIVGTLLLVQRFGTRLTGTSSVPLQVLGRTGIARGAMIAVVQVERRRFLVGAGEQGVRLLAELDEATASFDAAGTLSDNRAMVGSSSSGPGTGLADRLRAMTVRTPRPPRDPG